MLRRVLAMLLLVYISMFAASPAEARDGGESCVGGATLITAAVACQDRSHSGGGVVGASVDVVGVTEVCASGSPGACLPVPCPGMNLSDGFQMTEHLSDGTTRTVCQTSSDSMAAVGPSPGQVASAMRRLSWPASPLMIQPVDGRTLVNFRTNFYTTNAGPATRTVTLLGRRITIQATPSYLWKWGDGGQASGTSAGAAYPNLLVTHRYLHRGVVHPRLDTVYSGRFRIGNGAWRTIPGTLTVVGTPQRLEVVTARPVLVNPYG